MTRVLELSGSFVFVFQDHCRQFPRNIFVESFLLSTWLPSPPGLWSQTVRGLKLVLWGLDGESRLPVQTEDSTTRWTSSRPLSVPVSSSGSGLRGRGRHWHRPGDGAGREKRGLLEVPPPGSSYPSACSPNCEPKNHVGA